MKNFVSPPEFIGTFFEGDGIAVDVLTIVHSEGYELLHSTLDSIWVTKDSLKFPSKGSPQGDSCSLIALLSITPDVAFGSAGEVL